MLTLILIDVQYLQNVVFIIKKGSNRRNHSGPGPDSQDLVKKSPTMKFPNSLAHWEIFPYLLL